MSGADFHVPGLPPLGPNNPPGLCLPAAAAPPVAHNIHPIANEPARRRRSPSGPSKRVRSLCEVEGCTSHAQNGARCRRHGARVRQCGAEGCENNAVKGGVCKRHGAKVDRKQCSAPDCTNNAKRGGVCIRHGATKKKCSYAGGCDRVEHKGGLCSKHQPAHEEGLQSASSPQMTKKGSKKRQREITTKAGEGAPKKRKRPCCTVEGCQSLRKKDGVCVRHGAKVGKQCSVEDCTNRAKQRGVCVRHGADQKRYEHRCTFEGCNKRSYSGQPCALHGGQPVKSYAKVCSHEGCSSVVVPRFDVCIKHGAEREFKKCTVPDCESFAQKGGLCIRHGAKVKTCRIEGCPNNAKRNQLCIRHGANHAQSV